MSFADYSQRLEDHQRALVLVGNAGGSRLSARQFTRLFERLARLQTVTIPGQQRTLQLRYTRSYATENNEWGDFQAHRKVLGLVCVGACSSENELADVQAGYEQLKQQFASTIFDSRLLVFGLNKDGSSPAVAAPSSGQGGERGEDTDVAKQKAKEGGERALRIGSNKFEEQLSKEDRANSNTNVSGKKSRPASSDTFPGGGGSGGGGGGGGKLNKSSSSPIIDTKSPSLKSKQPIRDPLNANSLLENANKLQQQQEQGLKQESQPKEKEGSGGGSPHTLFYPSLEESADLEEKMREFAASLFWVLESKRMDRSLERQDRLMLLMTPFEKKDFVGIDTDSRTYKKRCQGRLRKHLADLCLLSGLPAEALLHYQTALDTLRSANDWLWLAGSYEGLCAASVAIMYPQVVDRGSDFRRNISFSVKRGVSAINESKLKSSNFARSTNGLDLADGRSRSCLLPEDIIDKYKEAIMHYSKFKNAGIIEMEASIKACRVLIMQQDETFTMEVQQPPLVTHGHHSQPTGTTGTSSPYNDAYMAALPQRHPATVASYGGGYYDGSRSRSSMTDDDEDSSHSAPGGDGGRSAAPFYQQHQATSASSTTYYGGFYKTLQADYQRQQLNNHQHHHSPQQHTTTTTTSAAAVMDFSRKIPPNSSLSPPPGDAVPEPVKGYGSAGGMVGARHLDSEGSSLKSCNSSDSGRSTHSPPQVDDDEEEDDDDEAAARERTSPLSTGSSCGDNFDKDKGGPAEHHRFTPPSANTGHYGSDPVTPPGRQQGEEESPSARSPVSPDLSNRSPLQGKMGSAKKQRLCSPNLNKIESVINNLRTAKAKKRERKEPPAQRSPVQMALPQQQQQQQQQQQSASDPRLWAMYALSQYAMMTPGGGVGSGHYPYPPAEGATTAAAAAYGSSYPGMAPPPTMNGGPAVMGGPSPTEAHGGRKRKQEEVEATDEEGQDVDVIGEVKSEPLDFSLASQTPTAGIDDGSGKDARSFSPTQMRNRKNSPASKSKNRKVKEQVTSEHSALWEELKNLARSLPTAKLLMEQYQRGVDEFETERYQALLDNISSDQCKDAVHAYYNHERLALVRRTRSDLEALTRQRLDLGGQSSVPHYAGAAHMMAAAAAAAAAQNSPFSHSPYSQSPFSHSTASPFTPVAAASMAPSSLASYPYASALYGLASGVPAAPPVPNFGAYSPMASYMATAMADDMAAMYGRTTEEETGNQSSTLSGSGGKRKFLTPEAVSRLQTWYDEHEDHPYPDDETVEELARDARVSVAQVKKWMANKRVRSNNTLAFNGSIHPKKIQKLIQLKEMAETAMSAPQSSPAGATPTTSMVSAATTASAPEATSSTIAYNMAAASAAAAGMTGSVAPHTPVAMGAAAGTGGKARTAAPSPATSTGKKNKRLLDPAATSYMTRWYHDHLSYPYPTDEEKHAIAAHCGLTVSQVTCWFANKRNRSNHSRKHSLTVDGPPPPAKLTVYDTVKREAPSGDGLAAAGDTVV